MWGPMNARGCNCAMCNRNQDIEKLQEKAQQEVNKMLTQAPKPPWPPLEQARDTYEMVKALIDNVESYDEMGTEEMYGACWRAMYALKWALEELER